MLYVSNAFALSMLDRDVSAPVIKPLSVIGARYRILPAAHSKSGFVSCVGHADTAAVFTDILGTTIACNRVSIKLRPGDVLIVGQMAGKRLPEGATTLPAGATLDWWQVTI